MLKSLEIINALHIHLFNIGNLRCKKFSDCYCYFNDNVLIYLDFLRVRISKNEFDEPLIITYEEQDCINIILNKVDEWIKK